MSLIPGSLRANKSRVYQLFFLLCLIAGLAWTAQATTYTVTKTADTNDGICDADCSLREAITAANANPGLDTIKFAIGSGLKTILPLSALPLITDPVTIDGTTQPGFSGSPLIEIDGESAGTTGCLDIQTSNTTVRGLIINRFRTVAIKLSIGGNNVVAGNHIGTNAAGSAGFAVSDNNGIGVLVYSANNIVGGIVAADRNIISGNQNQNGSVAVWLFGAQATGNRVVGNYVGPDVSGTIAIGEGDVAIWLTNGCSSNMVGGASIAERNLISGNSGAPGIRIQGANGNKVLGNFIGTKADGTSALGNGYGVFIDAGSQGNQVGGTNPGEGNTIVFSNGPGVTVNSTGEINNAILGNSIYSNLLGIDLGLDGVTANDLNDTDSGPNNLQNFPVLTSAGSNGGVTAISGTLNSGSNTQYRVEFFATGSCNPSGNGEGQTFLGSTNVTTVGNDATFNASLPVTVQNGKVITATATDPQGNTSEFSPCKQINAAPPSVQFSQASYTIQESLTALTITVTRSGDASAGASVDYATSDGQATQKGDFEYAAGTLTFGSGETTQNFQVLINDDNYVEGDETFAVSLTNPIGTALGAQSTSTITIKDNVPESSTNPINDPQSFVYTHYHDFLNREPDSSGLAFWTNQIISCGADQACIDNKRVNTSAAFFLSIEFQQTGYLVYRTYKASYGNLPGAPVPIRLNEFVPDTRQIGNGVIVNQSGWEQLLENNKQLYMAGFVQRSRFTLAFPTSLTPTQFVDGLFANAGVTPLAADRQAAIAEFGAAVNTIDAAARARALRRVAENSTFTTQEFNRAFVLMQYFGYLRRNPNDVPEPGLNYAGYNFWLNKLNQFNGNYNAADMVKAFIVSNEYRQRFGPN